MITDRNDNVIYLEEDDGTWWIRRYLDDGTEVYYEDSDGRIKNPLFTTVSSYDMSISDTETEIAMLNTFDVLTGKVSEDDLLLTDLAFFVHVPSEPIEDDVIRVLIKFFEAREDYDKCKTLFDMLK